MPGHRSCCGGSDPPACWPPASCSPSSPRWPSRQRWPVSAPTRCPQRPTAAGERPGTPILISGQIGAATASADTPVIRSSLREALGTVPFTLAGGRWSDPLTLPWPHHRDTIPLIQAAVLGGVTAHTELAAGNWPGPPRPGQPIGVALPVTTARMLGLAVGDVLVLRDSTTGAPARLRVAALFRVRDPGAPYWRLSLLGTSGALVQGTFITYGPMLVNPATLGRGGLTSGGASWLVPG